jgi:hypothetical protein
LPFVTDAEMVQLFGEDVLEANRDMSQYNSEKNICGDCTKRCCPMVRCELYDTRFSQCPVHNWRPLICRMHYCEKYIVGDGSFIREFADIYINSLLEAKLQGSQKVDLFDSPPLIRYAPSFIEAVSPCLSAFKEGRMDEPSALKLIQSEAENYRTAPVINRPPESKEIQALWEELKFWRDKQ